MEAKNMKSVNLTGAYWTRTSFSGLVHRVRLLTCILHDSIREDFFRRDDTKNKDELQARNSIVSFWDKVVLLYNDKNYIPNSVQLDESWGPWFVESKELPFTVFRDLEAYEVKSQFREYVNDMEAMYKKWKSSGAGKGMHVMEEEEAETGVQSHDLQELRTHGGDKIDFLKSRHPFCLYLWSRLEKCDAMVSSCPTLLDNSRASGSLTTTTSRVTKAQTTRATVVAMLEKATTQSAGIEGQMMATNRMIGMQVKFQALSNKSSQAHAKAEQLEEHVDEMEEKIVLSDLSGSRLEKFEALLAKKQKNLDAAKEEEMIINAQLERLQTSMDEAMMRVLHSKKKRRVESVNKENEPGGNMVAETDSEVELVELEKEPRSMGSTKRKIFVSSEFDSNSDNDSLPAAYKK
jgi:mannose/fructose-specific phosphotransferase system component IIA